MTPAVEFRDVSIAFDEQLVLDRVSFSVGKGEMKIITGRAASGKSTLLKLASGLIRPDSGQIFINGVEINLLSEDQMLKLRRSMGILFQGDALFSSLTVGENVAYPLVEQGWSEDDIEPTVREVLMQVGLEKAIDLLPEELSVGMGRRASVARAVVGRPEIILYDSPCAGLDPINAHRICDLAIRLRDTERVTSLWVTTELAEIKYLCSHFYDPRFSQDTMLDVSPDKVCLLGTKVLMLANGRVIFDDVEPAFWTSPNEEIRQFVG